MPIVIATTGASLLGFVAGVGVPIIFGIIARNTLYSVNEKAGTNLCRLRDLPWAVTSILTIPFLGQASYAMGFSDPNEIVMLRIIMLVLPLVPCLLTAYRCIRQGKASYILTSCIYVSLSIYSMFSVVPLTLSKRSV